MKTKLSETLKENGIDFTFPIQIKDANGKETYYENRSGYWCRFEYDAKGNKTFYENSTGFWSKAEYDAKGNKTFYENSTGEKKETPKSKSCAGKVVEIDGKKYKLTEL